MLNSRNSIWDKSPRVNPIFDLKYKGKFCESIVSSCRHLLAIAKRLSCREFPSRTAIATCEQFIAGIKRCSSCTSRIALKSWSSAEQHSAVSQRAYQNIKLKSPEPRRCPLNQWHRPCLKQFLCWPRHPRYENSFTK